MKLLYDYSDAVVFFFDGGFGGDFLLDHESHTLHQYMSTHFSSHTCRGTV